jgi:hypothetical protein
MKTVCPRNGSLFAEFLRACTDLLLDGMDVRMKQPKPPRHSWKGQRWLCLDVKLESDATRIQFEPPSRPPKTVRNKKCGSSLLSTPLPGSPRTPKHARPPCPRCSLFQLRCLQRSCRNTRAVVQARCPAFPSTRWRNARRTRNIQLHVAQSKYGIVPFACD